MMKNMTLVNIAKSCGGLLHGGEDLEREAGGVVIDSRKAEQGFIFIATRGERADGHDFIEAVAKQGAMGVVCEKAPECTEIPYILVEDSFQALREIAEFYRKQLSVKVVGITGSVGKTSTKEFVAGVLAQKYKVLKTQGNYNNEVGLPLTVLSIRAEHEVAVLEMGINHFGEMHRLSKIARPDICVMTNIGECHLENLGSREGILKAKSEIFDYMNPEGHVFVNGDDDMLMRIKRKGSHAPVCFGLSPSNEIYASNVMNKGLFGSEAVIHMNLTVFPVEIPLPGAHMVYNALAAASVGSCLLLTKEQIKEGIRTVEAVGGRSNVIRLAKYTLIDDCYNANPVSMKAAVDLLCMALGRKVAVLGDMFELGEEEKKLHAQVGAYAAAHNLELICCIGKLSRCMYEGAVKQCSRSRVCYYETKEELIRQLPQLLLPGDTVLIKASHGMKFGDIVNCFKEPD